MQRRAKLVTWILSFVAFFLVITPLSLYFLSPIIAQKGLEHWLIEQKFTSVELSMQPPAWDQLIIDKLYLQKNTEEQQLSIHSENILVRFDPIDLYIHQKITLLQLPQSTIKIKYMTDNTTQTETNEAVDLSNILPTQWFKKVPAELIQVGELNLELDYPNKDSDWRFIGALLFDGQELYSRIKFLRNDKDLGWGDLRLDNNNHFSLRLLEENEPFVTINGALSYNKQLELQSEQRFDIARLQRWQQALFPRPSKTIEPVSQFPKLSGSINSQGVTAFPLKTFFTPDALLKSIRTQQQIQADIQLPAPTKKIGNVDLSLEGVLNFSLSQLSFALSKNSHAIITDIAHQSLRRPIKQVKIALQTDSKVDINLANLIKNQIFSPQIDPLSLTINSSAIALSDAQLSPAIFNLDLEKIDLAGSVLKGKLSTRALRIAANKMKMPRLDLTTRFTLASKTLKHSFLISSTDVALNLTGNSTTLLNSLNSQFNWKLKPLSIKTLEQQLAHYIPLPAELRVLSGTLFHNGSGKFKRNKLSLRANNSIRQGAFNWDNTLIEGMEYDSTTTLSPSGKIIDKGGIKLERVTSGIEITKIQTRYKIERGTSRQDKGRHRLSLDAFQAELLDGKISVPTLQFDPLYPKFSTQVKIDQLDLGAVLKLEQQQGLSGEGKLSGYLPLSYINGELIIKEGELLSLAPGGKIIFQPTATVAAYAAANVGLNMAIGALSNFQYERLDIQLDYAADGTALLKTRLKGNNPDWNNGHPVDFTINIEENIPKLIKTLQFADKLTKTIEKRYR
jgi:hypothetical protein